MRAELPALLALDWGTSACRAYLLSSTGAVLDRRSSRDGVQPLASAGAPEGRQARFADAFDRVCGPWLEQSDELPVLACGMVGSSQGWVDAPYRQAPVDLASGPVPLAVVRSRGIEVHVVPGVVDRQGLQGVMRGEETELLGVLPGPHGTSGDGAEGHDIVLPGTHSKWVRTQGTVLESFTTFMTGEVYALLVRDSILGALAERPPEPAWDAFDQGVEVASGHEGAGGVLNTAFSARARVLTGTLPPAHVHDYLSGLMIGGELVAVRHSWLDRDRRPTLLCVGDSALSQRYSRAARHVGWRDSRVVADAAPAGLWRTAVAAGLLPVPGRTTSRQGTER